MMSNDFERVIRNILRDIEVELTDEFDRNFERQAFSLRHGNGEKSDPSRRSDTRGHRRSSPEHLQCQEGQQHSFPLGSPGGRHPQRRRGDKGNRTHEAVFWHKYYEATGSFGRKKDGTRRNDKRTIQLSTEAEFWKFMALMKVGRTIKIPQRKFIGTSPEVEATVREIIEENITEYFKIDFDINEK